MKYNPKACNQHAMLPEFLGRHPLAPAAHGQGFLACMYELQEMLKEVTGMQGVSLTPMAGAHGEFAGVAMIRAYHRARGDLAAQRDHRARGGARHQSGHRDHVRLRRARDPGRCATATSISTALRRAVGPKTAGIMLTNPSTLGVFERRIERGRAHRARGRRPAVLRRRQPERDPRQGAPRRHGLRRHPHEPAQDLLHAARRRRARAPGRSAWASGCCRSCRCRWWAATARRYRWLDGERTCRRSIGRLSGFMGNAGVLLRAYIYMRLLGRRGHAPRGRVRHAQCQLPAGKRLQGRRLRCRLSASAARATSSSSR